MRIVDEGIGMTEESRKVHWGQTGKFEILMRLGVKRISILHVSFLYFDSFKTIL